jgi:FixJ family two-component response regulator
VQHEAVQRLQRSFSIRPRLQIKITMQRDGVGLLRTYYNNKQRREKNSTVIRRGIEIAAAMEQWLQNRHVVQHEAIQGPSTQPLHRASSANKTTNNSCSELVQAAFSLLLLQHILKTENKEERKSAQ